MHRFLNLFSCAWLAGPPLFVSLSQNLVILEGIGGLSYSRVRDEFVFAENLPLDWDYMEYRVPVGGGHWVTARSERQKNTDGSVTKTTTVQGNPFGKLIVSPFTDDVKVLSAQPAGFQTDVPPGHYTWLYMGQNKTQSTTVRLDLDPASSTSVNMVEMMGC